MGSSDGIKRRRKNGVLVTESYLLDTKVLSANYGIALAYWASLPRITSNCAFNKYVPILRSFNHHDLLNLSSLSCYALPVGIEVFDFLLAVTILTLSTAPEIN